MKMLLEKAHVNVRLLQVFGKAFPALGESMQTLDNPGELHSAVHEIVKFLQEGLEEDHGSGISGEDEFISFSIAETGQEGTESVLGGSNGHREVDIDGSVGSGVSSSLLGTETTSEVPSLRYETEVQSGEGT
jgi:hypothetical protein